MCPGCLATVVVVAPELAISTPELDTTLARNTPFLVEGSAAGTAPGNVFVRALDSNGNVLADVRGETTRVNDAGDRWLWEAKLVVPDLPPGTRGMLYAYSLSLPDGAVIAAATQPVIYGEDSGDSYLLITDPLPYATTLERRVRDFGSRAWPL